MPTLVHYDSWRVGATSDNRKIVCCVIELSWELLTTVFAKNFFRRRLKTCIDLCRVHEVSVQQAKTIAVEEIHRVKANKGSKAGTTSTMGRTENSLKGKQCSFCRKKPPPTPIPLPPEKGRELCPADGRTCRKCGVKKRATSRKYVNRNSAWSVWWHRWIRCEWQWPCFAF